MKIRSTRSLRRLLFKIRFYCDYSEQIGQLEKALARKPDKLQLDIIGAGELSPDIALLIRSVLLDRSPKTHFITHARSSLQGGAVLVWLMGETRMIREDAKLYFRKYTEEEEDPDDAAWKDETSSDSEMDLEEADYAQVLKYIDQFLPVKELAGRPVDLEALRQFGLVDNEKMDRLLSSALGKTESSGELDKPGPEFKPGKVAPNTRRSMQPNSNE